jgi:hypothetical protein
MYYTFIIRVYQGTSRQGGVNFEIFEKTRGGVKLFGFNENFLEF